VNSLLYIFVVHFTYPHQNVISTHRIDTIHWNKWWWLVRDLPHNLRSFNVFNTRQFVVMVTRNCVNSELSRGMTISIKWNLFWTVSETAIDLDYVMICGRASMPAVFVGRSQQNARAVDLVESNNWNKDCRVYMGYNRALVRVRHLPTLPHVRSAFATTALLLVHIFLSGNPEARSKISARKLREMIWYFVQQNGGWNKMANVGYRERGSFVCTMLICCVVL
jgi:hypothetical protein